MENLAGAGLWLQCSLWREPGEADRGSQNLFQNTVQQLSGGREKTPWQLRGLKYLTFFLRASGESGLNMQTMLRTTLTYTLSSIPDQPTITGLGKAAQSNILLHQIPTVLTSFDFLG